MGVAIVTNQGSDSQMKHTVIYRFVCNCGEINSGTLSIVATNMDAARAAAKQAQFTCDACGKCPKQEHVALNVQLISF